MEPILKQLRNVIDQLKAYILAEDRPDLNDTVLDLMNTEHELRSRENETPNAHLN